MKRIKVNHKDIYIVESHNQVLKAWDSSRAQNVFSLDFHTDTRRAFHNYAWWRADTEVKKGLFDCHETRRQELADQKIEDYRAGRISIDQVNDNLRHDEHLDFAVRTGIADSVFILSRHRNRSSSNPNVYIALGEEDFRGQPLIEYSPGSVPGIETDESRGSDDSETLKKLADHSIDDLLLEEALTRVEEYKRGFFDSFILDIDCDYFNTHGSLSPERSGIINSLVREADCITIALEPECVKICRHQGEDLDSALILDKLLALIAAA